MKRINVVLGLVAVCSLIVATASLVAAPADEKVPAAARQQLAAARQATAKYHDVDMAVADGYVSIGYVPGEGFEYVNWSLVDCISFVVMEERRLGDALTTDRHFEQAGFKALLR